MKVDRVARRRQEILEAAYRIFSRKGYHDTNVADIASELGIGHGTFYRYFRNKLDVFSHVIDLVISKIAEVVASEDPESTNTLAEYEEQIERIGNKLFDLFTQDPHLSKLLFYESLGIDEEINAKVQRAFDIFGEYTARYLRNGIEKGFLRGDIYIRETALAINAMTFEAARRVVLAEDKQKARDVWIRTVKTLMIEGLAAR